ncbi:hypothetical protein L0152_08445 [bacterium]|nr:hypothetical protein [bacterium]
MEFGLCGDCGCDISCFISGIIYLSIIGIPLGFILGAYRWNRPWFEFNEFTRIEFPLPPVVPPAPYEPMPVAMMVGSCSETKRCAYCHEEFDCDSARRFCFACKSATHEECAILNGSCSVFGCSKSLG